MVSRALTIVVNLVLPDLVNGELNVPFEHFCGRGQNTDSAQRGLVCVNGIEHGEFTTRAANESRKSCKNGALCLCPGHGQNGAKCIFTDANGKIQSCRNLPDRVGPCNCTPNRCF